MATRPARLLLEQGGWLLLEDGSYLLLDGYPDVTEPDTDPGGPSRPRPNRDPDNIDDLADALLIALLLTA